MRTPFIAGNWKLYKTSKEAVEFITNLLPLIKDTINVEIAIAPVFTTLSIVQKALKGSNVKLASQDCFWEEEGAFTGAVSPKMLIDVGCSHVIIGHSERRQYFGETDLSVNNKIKSALKAGLTVIFCIGETLSEREQEKTLSVLKNQIEGGLSDLPYNKQANIIIAYEPVWAIGTGKTATDKEAQTAHEYIRKIVAKLFGNNSAAEIRIIYGGSVKPENISRLMEQPDIDGALVGGASLKTDTFAAIVNYNSK